MVLLRVIQAMTSLELIEGAGISIGQNFAPGDLGQLIYIHGVQNFADYGFNHVHEAYCAQIAVEFILCPEKGRSRAWLAKKEGKVRFVGFTGHKDPSIHLKMLATGFPFDSVQMPLNAFDANFR